MAENELSGIAEAIQARRDLALAQDLQHHLREGGCFTGIWAKRVQAALSADPAVAAFFISVDEAGEEARQLERERVRLHRVKRLKGHPPCPISHPARPIQAWAVAEIIPLWRSWGRLILDAERQKS